jgi:hypothetical protein
MLAHMPLIPDGAKPGPNQNVTRQGLTSESTQFLNEAFYKSNPASHFGTRLWALIESVDDPRDSGLARREDPDSLAAQFLRLLPGQHFEANPEAEAVRRRDALTLEALALLQHATETALRQFDALRVCDPGKSPWFEMANEKDAESFRKMCAKLANTKEGDVELRAALFPTYDSAVIEYGGETVDALVSCVTSWVSFFGWLLIEDGMDSMPAHNQHKHGMAVMARDDERVEFVVEMKDPSAPTVAEMNAGIPLPPPSPSSERFRLGVGSAARKCRPCVQPGARIHGGASA